MDERFQTYASKAAAFRAKAQEHRSRPRGPIESAINLFLTLLVFVVLLILIIPLIALIIILAIAFFIYFKIKSFFRGLGKPNAHVGPVRTDGRDNVKVINRD
jgi:hypothetical protein